MLILLRLIFVGLQNGTRFMSLFRRREFWGGSYIFENFVPPSFITYIITQCKTSIKNHKINTFVPDATSDEHDPSQASVSCTFSIEDGRLSLHVAPSSAYPFYVILHSSFIIHIIKFPEDALKKISKKFKSR
jgi:hypothetical protein